MKFMYLGDIVGRSGRDAVKRWVPPLRRALGLDLVVACGENAAHGFGITPGNCQEFYAAGIDVITLGNHAWDQRDIIPYIDGDSKLLRPLNYPPGTPGRGMGLYRTETGRTVLVAQVMCRLFMDPLDDPFAAAKAVVDTHPMRPGAVDAVIVDIHGEANSEKMALGHYLDGRASLVVGSHTHIPTADAQIFAGGTAYQSDAGMCGDYDSVIGMKKEAAIARFVRKMPGERLGPAEGEGTLCGVVVTTEPRTGRAIAIEPVRIGGRLAPALPRGAEAIEPAEAA